MEQSTCKKFRSLCAEYVNDSNIHGVRYVGEKHRPLAETICWFFILIVSVSLCGVLINSAYNNWNEEPVIITFAGKYESIYTIPIPSFTICPYTKAKRYLFNMTAVTKKLQKSSTYPFGLNADEISHLAVMMKVCDPTKFEAQLGNKILFDDRFFENLLEIEPDFFPTFLKCGVRAALYTDMCDMLLNQVLTDEGICYSFNVLPTKELFHADVVQPKYYVDQESHQKVFYKTGAWTMETGYQNLDFLFPERVASAHSKTAYSFWLVVNNSDIDFKCKSSQGFKIAVHTPVEIPRLSKEFFRLPPNKFLSMSIKPYVVKTSEDLRQYSPEKRQCFFNSERKLRYFKTYTQNNCEFECLTNATERECGCVEFYMPRTSATRLCGLASRACILSAEKKLLKTSANRQELKNNDNKHSCNCLPSCNSIRYDSELFMAENIVSESKEFQLGSANSKYELSRFTIGFKRNTYLPLQRSAVKGPTEFIAECGGLLGLFMGISFLSFVEIFYYFTMRFLVNLFQHDRKQNREEPPPIAQ